MSGYASLVRRAAVVALFAVSMGWAQDAGALQRLLEAGRPVEAWQQARQWAGRQPASAEAQYWSGLTALRCGAFDEAEAALGRSLKIRPASVPAAMALGETFDRQDRPAKAIEWYEKAWELDKSQSEPLVRIARVYQQNAAWSDAEEYFKRAQALGAGSVAEDLDAARTAAKEQASGVVSARSLAANSRGLKPPVKNAAEASVKAPAAGDDAARVAFQISFPRNKFAVADLSPTARAQLDEVAASLLTPEWKAKGPLLVEGHACSCGTASYNMELGLKRAEAIREYLIAKGALSQSESKSASMGSSNPVKVSPHPQLSYEACERDETHNMNRRVVLKEQRSGAVAQVSFWYRPATGGDFRPLTSGAALRTKDQIKVKLESFEAVHAYVFHHGSAGDWSVLFPNKGITPAAPANPLPNGSPLWIPGPGDGLSLDETPGPEETLVFVSPGPDPDLEKIASRLRGGEAVAEVPPLKVAKQPQQAPQQPPAQPQPQSQPQSQRQASHQPQAPPTPATSQLEDYVISTRGLKGVPASAPGNLLLKLRSFASVKFEHKPAQ
jgi:peptidoglycan-associated lipoprotein